MGVENGTSDHGRTVRQRILDKLFTKLKNMQDGGKDVWQYVVWGDTEGEDNQKCPMVGLDFGTEDMLNNSFPCSEYELPVILNFRYRGKRGLAEHDVYHYYLGLLQFAMLGDHNLDGLALNVREDSNAPSIVGIEDVYPGGTLVATVIYKTRLHNPYKQPHEAP